MTTCNATYFVNGNARICSKESSHEGIHEDAFTQLVELQPGEREHLRRFMKWLNTSHFVQKYGGFSAEGVVLHEKPDDIVDTYVEWLKLGEPR